MFFSKQNRVLPAFVVASLIPVVLTGAIKFTNVTQQQKVRGLDYFGGHGISWADVNGDGLLDIYVKNAAGSIYDVPNNLFINLGGSFVEEAAVRGVTDAYGLGTHGAVLADYDGDGDYDIFSTVTYDRSPAINHLYRNNGNGFFTDVTSLVQPPQQQNTSARGVAAGDFDRDGDMDFFISDALPNTDPFNPIPFPPKNLNNFFKNKPDGTFSTQFRGIAWTGFVQGVCSGDVDNDGDIDIIEAKWTPPTTLYLNDGLGQYTDSGTLWGLPQTPSQIDNGVTLGDLDNDGDLDLSVIGPGRVDLYKNLGNRFIWYQRISYESESGAHTSLGDFDHDGDLDLYINGHNVYENDGTGLFTMVLPADSGLQDSLNIIDPRGAALGDFDNDGDLDIYCTDADSYNVLFRNDLNDSNWIQVELIGDNGAVGPYGTRVDLYEAGHIGEANFLAGHREITSEYGYLGQDMPIAHFGAPTGKIYDVQVTFMDGQVKTANNITPGQKIKITYVTPLPPLYPPANFRTEIKINKALMYWEKILYLRWDTNPENKDIVKYRLYTVSSGVQTFLKEYEPDTFEHMIRYVEGNKSYSYALTVVDIHDRESEAVTVTVDVQ